MKIMIREKIIKMTLVTIIKTMAMMVVIIKKFNDNYEYDNSCNDNNDSNNNRIAVACIVRGRAMI